MELSYSGLSATPKKRKRGGWEILTAVFYKSTDDSSGGGVVLERKTKTFPPFGTYLWLTQ